MKTLTELSRQDYEQAVFGLVTQEWNEPREVLLENLTDALHTMFPSFTGVYIYLLNGEWLELSNFRGRPTEHTRIALGQGICGRAARRMETITVDDVNMDGDYLACSVETRSEIVVPIMREGRVFGEIDIDSDIPAAFDAHDREFLEELAEKIQEKFD